MSPRRHHPLLLPPLAAVLFGAACASNETAATAPTVHDELVAYLDAERLALCETATTCCSETERRYGNRFTALLFAPPNLSTTEACLAELEKLVPASMLLGVVENALADGRATFDPSKVDACLAEWAGCAIPLVHKAGALATRCSVTPLIPAVQLGGACVTSADCVEGGCTGPAGKRTCAALPKEGEACAEVDGVPKGCADPLTCSDASKTCVKLGELGAPCAMHDDCASGECHGRPFEEGHCAKPTLCNGDVTDDPDVVVAACDDSMLGIACELGTADAWSCTCTPESGPTTTCAVPFKTEQVSGADTCAVINCCAK